MPSTLTKNELILLSAGEYSDTFQIGVFRAERDLDLTDLADRFAKHLDRIDPDCEHMTLNGLASNLSILGPGDAGYDPGAALFAQWLVDEGHLARVPVATAHIETGRTMEFQHTATVTARPAEAVDEPSSPSP